MPTRPTWAAWVGTRTTWVLWGLPVAGGVVAAVVFLARPEIDLGVARLFHAPETGFVGQRLGWVRALRQGFVALYVGTIALCIAGLGLMWGGRRQWLGLGKTQWLYLAACLAAGPGLIANLVLKDNWGRARPSQITEFGGA
jgi:lipid A 4'-phosphatase